MALLSGGEPSRKFKRVGDNLNTKREEGDPPYVLASPIMVGKSPLPPNRALDLLANVENPPDTIGWTPSKKGKRR